MVSAKLRSRRRLAWMSAVAFVCAAACGMGPESIFELAKDSRVPRWCAVPEGVSRANIRVTLKYYIDHDGRDAEAIVVGKDQQLICDVRGTSLGLYPFAPEDDGHGGGAYPSYELITINGIAEVVEHRREEPVFFVSDDPKIRLKIEQRWKKY